MKHSIKIKHHNNAAKYFYRQGWNIINGKCICKECAEYLHEKIDQGLHKQHIANKLKNAKCPKCGDSVFLPSIRWQKYYNGKVNNPIVMCRDMGHWIGTIDECKEV